ncbi:hypothetical protein NOVO_09240 (plasmid) [Rickettsiales bacterium Ac37b]|nr:hypothetical protein NOVO_09240 [Rickettsiales bacterium Ac37b]
MIRLASILFFILFLSNCSSYRSSWDCPKAKGIGCSSLEYADNIAREQILLNSGVKQKKKILINQDPYGESTFEEVEVLR